MCRYREWCRVHLKFCSGWVYFNWIDDGKKAQETKRSLLKSCLPFSSSQIVPHIPNCQLSQIVMVKVYNQVWWAPDHWCNFLLGNFSLASHWWSPLSLLQWNADNIYCIQSYLQPEQVKQAQTKLKKKTLTCLYVYMCLPLRPSSAPFFLFKCTLFWWGVFRLLIPPAFKLYSFYFFILLLCTYLDKIDLHWLKDR